MRPGTGKYVPEELNPVFGKFVKQIYKVIHFVDERSKQGKVVDYTIISEQLGFYAEKFACQLLKTMKLTKARFVSLPRIQCNSESPTHLHFFKEMENDGDKELILMPFIPPPLPKTKEQVEPESKKRSDPEIEKLKAEYKRELQVLREIVCRKEIIAGEIEVPFFHPNKDMDEYACLLANARLKELQRKHTTAFQKMKATNSMLLQQLKAHQVLRNGKIDGLALEELFERLEGEDPKKVWEGICRQLGYSYFLEIIENDLGLNSTVREDFEKEYEGKLEELREQCKKVLDSYKNFFTEQIQNSNKIICEKNEEIERTTINYVKDLRDLRVVVFKEMKAEFNKELFLRPELMESQTIPDKDTV